jgi:hypothetical protein
MNELRGILRQLPSRAHAARYLELARQRFHRMYACLPGVAGHDDLDR